MTAITTISYQSGGEGSAGGSAISEPSTAERASTMVSQFSQAKLPDSTSHNWVSTITPAAALATG